VADGTPAELGAKLATRTLRASSAQPRRAAALLSSLEGITSVAQVGNELRVLTEPGFDRLDALRARLQADDPASTLERTPPSLEDVFVAATHGRKLAPKEAA